MLAPLPFPFLADPCANYRWCCPNGDTCVPSGCCPGNTRQCRANWCYDPSTQKCCNDYVVCAKDEECVGGGCCPGGHRRCGNTKCYNPNTQTCCTGPGTVWGCDRSESCCSGGFCRSDNQHCCERGSCDNDTTCCRYECCRSIAYCGSDGYCKPCPPATRTVTATYTSTSVVFRTSTITRDPAPETENAPAFTCIPMTATNAEGATLELGDDCALKYNPPTTTTPAAVRRESNSDPTAAPNALLPRQNCVPWTTLLTTRWITHQVTTTQTRSKTIRGPGDDEGFSCPTMEVTNAAGDVLAMDESCALSFSPATPTLAPPPIPDAPGFTAAGEDGPPRPVNGAGSLWNPPVAVRSFAIVAGCVVYILM